jgi:5-methylthioadenosine/S-adenosylhomocysteine deaminase
VQIKVRIDGPKKIIAALKKPEIQVVYERHYYEHDTYFVFEDPTQGLLRYREDDFINQKGEIENVRYRLTLVGEAREYHYPGDVLLSRSRFLAPATQSLRFYREYFKPDREIFIEKDRLRWLVKYKDTEFYVNIDHIQKPEMGHFLEIKSRTWSSKDAERKSELAAELVSLLGASAEEAVSEDYVEIAKAAA